jgi:hypothetical protein
MRLPGEDTPLRARLLRIAVTDDDRAAVVGDTLRRVAARARVVVRVARGGPDRLELNVPPPDLEPGALVDVVVGTLDTAAGHRVDVQAWSRVWTEADPAVGDPLAVRLLLLDTPLDSHVDPAGLPDAREELARWRRRVGEWARQPSAPPPADAVAAVAAALDDGLDTPRALALLRDLETDAAVAAGARLEAFLTLDRLLGLDLALGLVRQ